MKRDDYDGLNNFFRKDPTLKGEKYVKQRWDQGKGKQISGAIKISKKARRKRRGFRLKRRMRETSRNN